MREAIFVKLQKLLLAHMASQELIWSSHTSPFLAPAPHPNSCSSPCPCSSVPKRKLALSPAPLPCLYPQFRPWMKPQPSALNLNLPLCQDWACTLSPNPTTKPLSPVKPQCQAKASSRVIALISSNHNRHRSMRQFQTLQAPAPIPRPGVSTIFFTKPQPQPCVKLEQFIWSNNL